MKCSIFTPTQRYGIDISAFSIARQKTDAEIQWIVCDELFAERSNVFQQVVKPIVNCETKHFYTSKKEGNVRNLARAYNLAMDYARDWGADLFISMQDYIYVPEDGVQKFVEMYEKVEVKNDFKAIYSGICSISADPKDDLLHDREAMFSIFKEPYDKRPEEIEWMDVRYRIDPSADYHYCPTAVEFETNWAAIPASALYDEELSFDEEFDKAVAFENQDFAYRASSKGYGMLLDMDNQVLSLPHKRYFSEEWEFEKPLTKVNQKIVQDRWGMI